MSDLEKQFTNGEIELGEYTESSLSPKHFSRPGKLSK